MKVWANCCNVSDLSLCCIPKAASTSQKAALLDSLGAERSNIHGNPLLNRSLPRQATGRTAAFIRYPWLRIVGVWAQKLHGPVTNVTRGFIKRGFRPGMPFEEYLERLPEVYLEDCHTAPQYLFLPGEPEFLGRVESIREDWPKLQGRHPWLHDLPYYGNRYFEPMIKASDLGMRVLRDLYGRDIELWEAACA